MNMTLRERLNDWIHPFIVKYVMRAYNKKVESRFKEQPQLAKKVDPEVTYQHLKLYGRLGYPCSDKWLRFYTNLTGRIDYTYLPEDLFFGCIERVLNDCNRASFEAEDKNLLSIFVEKEYLPKVYLRLIRGLFMDDEYNVLCSNDVHRILSTNNGDLICKVAVATLGGMSVSSFTFHDGKYIDKQGNILTEEWILKNHESFILQERVCQCSFSAKFNPFSVNTCRITTLRCPWDGKIVVTKAAMRFGVADSAVDNMHSGGVSVGLGLHGELGEFAFSYNKGMSKYDKHPSTGVLFKGEVHPFYDKMCDTVLQQASKIPNFNLLSWDVVADQNGDIKIIEVNQVGQGTDIHQFAYGSFFGPYTEKVIDWVACHKSLNTFKHFRTFNY